jgi:hypothetical protein
LPPLSPLLPSIPEPFLAALRSINIEMFPTSLPTDCGYAFPNPNIFFDNQKEAVKVEMLHSWIRLRPAFLFRVSTSASPLLSQPYSSKIWRRIVQFTPDLVTATRIIQPNYSKSAREKHEALAVLDEIITLIGEVVQVEKFLKDRPYWRGDELPRPDAIDSSIANTQNLTPQHLTALFSMPSFPNPLHGRSLLLSMTKGTVDLPVVTSRTMFRSCWRSGN